VGGSTTASVSASGFAGSSRNVVGCRWTLRYGVLEKHAFPEVPPRVEYRLTPLGERLNVVLDAIDKLQDEVDTRPPL
jgi:DNA-binding HxlR family transcriptional regulator